MGTSAAVLVTVRSVVGSLKLSRDGQTDKQTDRQTEVDRQLDRDRERERESEREREGESRCGERDPGAFRSSSGVSQLYLAYD